MYMYTYVFEQTNDSVCLRVSFHKTLHFVFIVKFELMKLVIVQLLLLLLLLLLLSLLNWLF